MCLATSPKRYVASSSPRHSADIPQVLECIGDIFSGARAIQDWLTLSAKLIARSIPTDRVPMAMEPLPAKAGKAQTRLSKELMTSVVWTSPLGLPVVQPYRKPVRKQVSRR